MLNGFKKKLDQSLEFITALTMGVLVIDVTWQVITRFILKNPSDWTEELATYLLIWVGLLGAAVALHRRAHLGIDYFVGKFKIQNRLIAEMFVHISVFAFSASVLFLGGFELVLETFELGQVAPATGIKLGYVYLAVPISGFFICMYSIEFLMTTFSNFKKLRTEE